MNILNGKKVIFVGNSFTYYGKVVIDRGRVHTQLQYRQSDPGYFYQLCKKRGADVNVTNWTFGGHDFPQTFFGPCDYDRECKGVDHLSELTDRSYDYVMLQRGSASKFDENFLDCCKRVMKIFSDVNHRTKFVYLVQHHAYATPYVWLNQLKELEALDVTIVDWGRLVYDIYTGAVSVPGAVESYNKNSLVVCQSEKDGFHQNMLAGYITALMTYCAITGESAVGQDYSFCSDTSLHPQFDLRAYADRYYGWEGSTTNFPEIFASEPDMRGIQALIDQYLAEKKYRNY